MLVELHAFRVVCETAGKRDESKAHKTMRSRFYAFTRALLFSTSALLLVGCLFIDGNGKLFGLNGTFSIGLMTCLFVACATTAILTVIFDKAMRVFAIIVLIALALLLPHI